jgi:hypothetical protein
MPALSLAWCGWRGWLWQPEAHHALSGYLLPPPSLRVSVSVSGLIADPPTGTAAPPILPPPDGFLVVDRTKFHAAFAADVSADVAAQERPAEAAAQRIGRLLEPLLIGPLRKYAPTDAAAVARTLVRATATAPDGVMIIDSDRI